MHIKGREERSAEILLSSFVQAVFKEQRSLTRNSPFRMSPTVVFFLLYVFCFPCSTLVDCLIWLFMVGNIINYCFSAASSKCSLAKVKSWVVMHFISEYNQNFYHYWYYLHTKYPEQILYTGSECHAKKFSLMVPWKKQDKHPEQEINPLANSHIRNFCSTFCNLVAESY